ncbi:MAG: sigma-54-dependent Fis family transcriptional regulator [Betaproteobacteria bacterium]|nr:sigma-54-dependent Fis family transcriptional regulator [Betaproteobacteria bacterium]MCC6246801.1 sigma-54-dependent Fis family transcriptional regulator [Rubrivivax sp.]
MTAHAAAASPPPGGSPRLLVVDDEPDLRTLYELTLLREGYDVECAGGVDEAWGMLAERPFQLVITDMRLPDGTGLDLLHRMEAAGRGEKAMVITAYASPENAVEALKAGAYDYLTKPVDLRQFRAVVASALGRTPAPPRERATEGRGAAPRAGAALSRLAGESPAMQQVRSLIEKVARSMAPVLVAGESGTGKELVARAIHETSPRAAAPFVAVNCGAIPEALLEAEFFGFRKGAFTGAHEDREGFFQMAQGGTLFLDEIGDLPLAMQSKLLRVIQERAVRQLGAAAEVPVNVRIVSATHKDLGAEVQAARFRQDLYYRLNVIRIAVPPLRERIADLPAICAAVLARIARDAGVSPVPILAPEALQQLLRHPFPGNVRELENLLHRALALATGPAITHGDLGLIDGGDDVLSSEAQATGLDIEVPAAPLPRSGEAETPLPSDLAAHLDNVERDILERALAAHRYNRTAAGASLGLSLRQMRYRMARLGVLAPDAGAGGPSGEGNGAGDV